MFEEQEKCEMQCDTEDKNWKPCCGTGHGKAKCGSINGEGKEVWSTEVLSI